MNKRLLVPLSFFLLAGILYWGLFRDPKEVPSPLIGKPAPAFTLTQLGNPNATFSPADMKGKVWLMNVWASWCASCKEEHPVLLELQKKNFAPIVGFNYKDQRAAGLDVLKKTGDPFVLSAFDADGKVGLDWGVYGAPETFLIDAEGIIRAKHVGPITHEIVAQKFAPFAAAPR
ncbi:MAG: DsbE family thiol:disulfide interchange protein [Betaproteobacteria bacterium]|nr:MAG: DsbE family thiol:disulfide interchange protein [Betaproteobacteria bacterium]